MKLDTGREVPGSAHGAGTAVSPFPCDAAAAGLCLVALK